MIESLRYKLRCFGIPVEGCAVVFCDNMSVVNNLNIPTSVLNKRHNAIYHHMFWEAQAVGILRVGWIPGDFNLSDLFTKSKMPGNKTYNSVDLIFSITASPIYDIEKA